MQISPYILPSLISTALGVIVVLYVIYKRPGRAWPFMLAVAVLLTAWCTGQLFWVTASTQAEIITIAKYQYIPICTLAPTWLLFTTVESGKRLRVLDWRWIGFLIPAITLFYAFNYKEGIESPLWEGFLLPPEVLIPKTKFNTLFWLLVFNSYVLIGLGSIQLFNHYSQSAHYRVHLFSTVFIPVILLIINGLYISGIWPTPLDPTPGGFAFGLALLGWAMYKKQFLDFSPLARNLALDSINDGVFVLDYQNRIVDINRAACKMCQLDAKKLLGKTLPQVFPALEADPNGSIPKLLTTNEMQLEVSRSNVSNITGDNQGSVVIFRDVTEQNYTHKLLLETQDALQHANQELNKIAHTDALTGLANRRMMLLRLEDEIARAQRKNHPLAVLFIDLDRFKQVNDQHGHLVGDEVLKAAGKHLLSHRKGFDLAARYGGEELVLALTETDIAGAQVVACRLWKDLREMEHQGRSGPFKVTACIGIAMLTPQYNTAEALIDRADQALYYAKHHGRDCVCMAGPSGIEVISCA